MDNVSLKPIICSIELRNFRCFEDKKIVLDAPLIIIEGNNGSGKTSLIEALYFAGHMRSCKTAHVDHLIKQEKEAFFLKISTTSNDILYIGVEHKKKVIKVNQKQLRSLKEVQLLLTVISIVDTDMLLVQGGPAERRLFLDEALLLLDGEIISSFKKLKNIVKNRNDFLQRGTLNETLYTILTEQLVECSLHVQQKRFELLHVLSTYVNNLIQEYNVPINTIQLTYTPKIDFTETLFFTDLVQQYKKREYAQGRTLFGAHLDDFAIYWGTFDARKHCSRGQQKLLVMLLKISLAKLCNTHNKQIVLLVDDFITDFDHINMHLIMTIFCSMQGQLIFTSPLPLLLQSYIPTSIKSLTVNL